MILLRSIMMENLREGSSESIIPALMLQKDNLSNNDGSFLDFLIKTENNQVLIQLYDKRDGLPSSREKFPTLKATFNQKYFILYIDPKS